jgi:hypothetical protein
MPSQYINLDESWFQGAVSFETGPGWIRPWRLTYEELPLFPAQWPDAMDALAERAQMAAGVRLRFRTDARTFSLSLDPQPGERKIDLVVDNRLVQTTVCPAETSEVTFTLDEQTPAGQNVLELWLDQMNTFALSHLILPEGTTAEPAEDTRRRWVTYGSSITHCGAAHSPARTWPATAARQLDVHLTCLGYGGQCHMDPMVARMIRDLPADVITLKLGINMQGGTQSLRSFMPAAIGLVKIIREKHPETPIGVISPIVSPPRETAPGATGLTLCNIREMLQEVVSRLKACGDDQVQYFEGLSMCGHNDVDCLPDDLHPDGDGYEMMGRRFAEQIAPELFG